MTTSAMMLWWLSWLAATRAVAPAKTVATGVVVPFVRRVGR